MGFVNYWYVDFVMPPRTRKLTKGSKENAIPGNRREAFKNSGKCTKLTRKPLADKTNSASDDNISSDVPKKAEVENVTNLKDNVVRPRRDRRIPSRYVDNNVLKNLSNNAMPKSTTPMNCQDNVVNRSSVVNSPLQKNDINISISTPSKEVDGSLITNRPKRIHHLPSRFKDHSISPSKFIPLQPCHASTPITKTKSVNTVDLKEIKSSQRSTRGQFTKRILPQINPSVENMSFDIKLDSENDTNSKYVKNKTNIKQSTTNRRGDQVTSSDTSNQDAEKQVSSKDINLHTRVTRQKTTKITTKTPLMSSAAKNNSDRNNNRNKNGKMKKTIDSPNNNEHLQEKNQPLSTKRRVLNKNFSFKVLDEKKEIPEKKEEKLAVYEFTYDPNEEPPPQKKKKKINTRKRAPPKPKIFVMKHNYNKNMLKSMTNLMNTVHKKTETAVPAVTSTVPNETSKTSATQAVMKPKTNETQAVMNPKISHLTKDTSTEKANNEITSVETNVNIEPAPIDFHDDHIDYSPPPSPILNPTIPVKQLTVNETRDQDRTQLAKAVQPHTDPLNLRDEDSLFDELPVASSSLNGSVKHPLASPWRAEFENLPIKWKVNTYVKPNMTPALESSFINFNDSKEKKHVYTNVVEETNIPLPEIVTTSEQNDDSKLKQTSIISFFKEVIEKNANKKNRCSVTPTRANSMFNESHVNTSAELTLKRTPKKLETPKKNNNNNSKTASENTPNSREMISPDIRTPLKRKTDNSSNDIPEKAPKQNKVATAENYFGFDDSGESEQENVSPSEGVNKKRRRGLRMRSRGILSEYNKQTGPLRAKSAKTKFAPSSEIVNDLYKQMKTVENAPVFSENVDKVQNTVLNESDPDWEESRDIEDSQPIPLFEDVEVVHHTKVIVFKKI